MATGTVNNPLVIIKSYSASYSVAAGASVSISATDLGISAISGMTPVAFVSLGTGSGVVVIRGFSMRTSGDVLYLFNTSSGTISTTVHMKMAFMSNVRDDS